MVGTLYNGKLVAPLEELAKTDPSKIIFISSKKQLKAIELFNNAKTIASNLLQKNFKEGDTVVMAVEPGMEFLKLIYALLMLHAKIAIIDPEMGKDNYGSKIKQLAPKWIFVDSRLLLLNDWPFFKNIVLRFRKNLPAIDFNFNANIVKVGNAPARKKHISYSQLLEPKHNDAQLKPHNQPYDSIIVYTSGTLDVPKGVLHSDHSLCTTIDLLRNIIAGDKNDIVGTYLPHFMLLGVASGLVVKIMPAQMEAEKKINWLTFEKINILFGPPSELLPLIIYCEKNNQKLPSTLKHLMLGSAPVHQGFLKRLLKILNENTKVTCTYGMTEHLLVAIADGREKVNYYGEGDLLGKLIPIVDIKINEDMEIIVRSEQIYTRYYHLKEREDWHSTGDLGKIDKDGNLILLGRKKEMIIRRDFNLYPALYEGTIKKIPGVNEVAFVGIYSDELHDEKVYLAIESESMNMEEIRRLLEKGIYSIDKQALPDKIFQMKIPRKGRQDKIDRQAIAEFIKEKAL